MKGRRSLRSPLYILSRPGEYVATKSSIRAKLTNTYSVRAYIKWSKRYDKLRRELNDRYRLCTHRLFKHNHMYSSVFANNLVKCLFCGLIMYSKINAREHPAPYWSTNPERYRWVFFGIDYRIRPSQCPEDYDE